VKIAQFDRRNQRPKCSVPRYASNNESLTFVKMLTILFS
jgi:hypothetical protein